MCGLAMGDVVLQGRDFVMQRGGEEGLETGMQKGGGGGGNKTNGFKFWSPGVRRGSYGGGGGWVGGGRGHLIGTKFHNGSPGRRPQAQAPIPIRSNAERSKMKAPTVLILALPRARTRAACSSDIAPSRLHPSTCPTPIGAR
jgi:hypothetical protein